MGLSVAWNVTEELQAFDWSPQSVADPCATTSSPDISEDGGPRVDVCRPLDFLTKFAEWSQSLSSSRIRPLIKQTKLLAQTRRKLLADALAIHTTDEWLATIASIKSNKDLILDTEERLRKLIDQAVSAQREAELRLTDLRTAISQDDEAECRRQLVNWADARDAHYRMFNLVTESRHDIAAAFLVNALTLSIFLAESWQAPLYKLLLTFTRDLTTIWGRIARLEQY